MYRVHLHTLYMHDLDVRRVFIHTCMIRNLICLGLVVNVEDKPSKLSFIISNFAVYYNIMSSCCLLILCAGEVVDLSDYDYNAVASLLKLYLRELPEPLIPQKLLTKMEAATQCEPAVRLGVYILNTHTNVWI